MDGGEPERWSAVADAWSDLWGGFAEPAWRAIAEASGIGPGTSVLDVGCGGGELLAFVVTLGAVPAGVDPAAGMRERSAARVSGAEIRSGTAEELPWPDASFEVVTVVNALQFADDRAAALTEIGRVLVPGGRVAVANWAEAARNDLDAIEAAVAAADGTEPTADAVERLPGGLETILADAGYRDVTSGLATTPWRAADDATLVQGVLLGEDATTIAELAPTVLAAAAPFRGRDGSTTLTNAVRWAVGSRA